MQFADIEMKSKMADSFKYKMLHPTIIHGGKETREQMLK